jgi:pimeloyl-[acyl-carrier protein] synthase
LLTPRQVSFKFGSGGAPMAEAKLIGPELIADPYPIYSLFRKMNPVFRDPEIGAWIVTSYDGVSVGLRDSRFSSDRFAQILQLLKFPGFAHLAPARIHSFLDRDPPDHTRLRGLVNKAFTPNRIVALEARIQTLVDQLIEAFPRDHFDMIAALAEPLPLIVIAELLGVPATDREKIKHWSDAIANVFSGSFEIPEVASLSRAAVALSELFDYLAIHIEQRRRDPRDDLLTALVRAEDNQSRLSEDEIYSTILVLLIAGNETTTNLIGNGLYALLRHPEVQQNLWTNPSLLPQAIEEMLRYDPPVQMITRRARGDVELMGTLIPDGEKVYFILGAANRDPAHFPEPDSFLLTRDQCKHISFGVGPHYCLGATLARLEGTVVFRSLIQRYSQVQLVGEPPVYRENFNLRGLKSLKVTVQT